VQVFLQLGYPFHNSPRLIALGLGAKAGDIDVCPIKGLPD